MVGHSDNIGRSVDDRSAYHSRDLGFRVREPKAQLTRYTSLWIVAACSGLKRGFRPHSQREIVESIPLRFLGISHTMAELEQYWFVRT